jgi:N-acylneuraminate cytidylyltransferase
MDKVIALIPARAGSKGVPNKNIRILGDWALIAWSIAAAKKSKCIDRIIVSTDSPEYAQIAVNMGAEAPFIRPAEIAGDRSTDYDFIKHALDWFLANGAEPDYIVHLRPTTPFRDPDLIDQAINLFRETPAATALRSVHEMPESAYKTFEITRDYILKPVGSESTELDAANSARQQFPTTYVGNGYVDILSTTFVRKNQLMHGNAVVPFITPRVTELDSIDDFEQLEYELYKFPQIKDILFNTK